MTTTKAIEAAAASVPTDSPARKPTALTPELAERLVTYLKGGNHLEVACRAAGVTRDTFNTWMHRARDGEEPFNGFALQVDEAMALAEVNDLAVIQRASQETWSAAAWRLERRYPQRWSKKERTEISGPDGAPIQSAAITATLPSSVSSPQSSPARAAEVMRELFGRVTPAMTDENIFDEVFPQNVPVTLDESLPVSLASDDDDAQ